MSDPLVTQSAHLHPIAYHINTTTHPIRPPSHVIRDASDFDRYKSMQVIELAIPDVKILIPRKHQDHRGFFSETYNRHAMAEAGIHDAFVQDNQSLSVQRGVVRGLHYQIPPRAQGKLVRVIRGSILDVAVDIRKSSPTFGKHVTEILSADNWKQMWVPPGFAHGFVTLEENTEVLYKVTQPYSPADERAIAWNDPTLAVDWIIPHDQAVLSDRDRKHPTLNQAWHFD